MASVGGLLRTASVRFLGASLCCLRVFGTLHIVSARSKNIRGSRILDRHGLGGGAWFVVKISPSYLRFLCFFAAPISHL